MVGETLKTLEQLFNCSSVFDVKPMRESVRGWEDRALVCMQKYVLCLGDRGCIVKICCNIFSTDDR